MQEQQATIRKIEEYNLLLSHRVAAYISEINRLKALVVKLQRMQFDKSSEKLREKTARQVREVEDRIGALQEEMSELLEPLYDLLRQYVLMPGSDKTQTTRQWVYVRDDRNAGSLLPPAVWFAYSPNRKGIHPQRHLVGRQRYPADGYRIWLAYQTFPLPSQQIAFQHYCQSLEQIENRIKQLVQGIDRLLPDWSLYNLVCRLQALKGVGKTIVITLASELGRLRPFP